MPIIRSHFKPAWWLPGPHLQTLWPGLCRRRPQLSLQWQRLELADGDFLDLCWPVAAQGPVVVVVHGLEGNLQSHYAMASLAALTQAGFQPLFMHMRNCSDSPNRLERSYHSGDTADIATVASACEQIFDKPAEAMIGFSLGGNQLLKWLGESGELNPLRAAVAVSVPFRLADAATRLQQGSSRLYQNYLLNKMRRSYKRRFSQSPSPLDVDVDQLTSFWQFDDAITAPLNGFADVDDYYTRASSRQYLQGICRPTLILHAVDDPFMFPETLPEAAELSDQVLLERAEHGGHVGFVSGSNPFKPVYWLEKRVTHFLSEQLAD